MNTPAHSRRYPLYLLSIAVSLGLLVWIFAGIDWTGARALLRQARPWFLVAALFCSATAPFFMTLRWLGVLRGAEGPPVAYAYAFRAVMGALLCNSFLPSKGGDLVKAVAVRKQYGIATGVGSVILERLVDLFLLGALATIASVWNTTGVAWIQLGPLFMLASGAVFVLAVAAPVDKIPVLRGKAGFVQKVRQFRGIYHTWSRSPAAVAQTVMGSLCSWGVGCAVICLLATALSQSIPPDYGKILAAFPLAILSGLVPVTISGMGVRDGVLVAALKGSLGYDKAVMIAMGYTICVYWWLSLLAVLLAPWGVTKTYKTAQNDVT